MVEIVLHLVFVKSFNVVIGVQLRLVFPSLRYFWRNLSVWLDILPF